LNWRPILRRLLLICFGLHSYNALAGTDVLVTSVRGVARNSNAAIKRFDQLSYQQRLDVAGGAQMVLVDLNSMQQYELTGPGQFVLGRDGVQQHGGSVQRKPLSESYRGIDLDDTAATHAGATLRFVAPADNDTWPALPADQQDERITSRAATLRWPSRPHIGAWQLSISELDGKVLYQASVSGNRTVLPDTLTLAPEHDYRRELAWRGANGTRQSSSVVLRTLPMAQAQLLTTLAPSDETPPAERLMYAVWLRSLGVRGLAEDYSCLLYQEHC